MGLDFISNPILSFELKWCMGWYCGFILPITISVVVFNSGYFARRSIGKTWGCILFYVFCVFFISVVIGLISGLMSGDVLSVLTLVKLFEMGLVGVFAFFIFQCASKMNF